MTGGDLPEWKFEEWECIKTRRARAFGGPRETEEGPPSNGAGPKNLVGLSLSGGGIRSAIYNDGFLQGLSHRGFLRYVDYMCSVSGGGYIAGHLVSQVRHEDDDEEKCFHDDKGRRNLGRDPITGEVCPRRLAGVGGYLSRTMEFLPAYLWSFFFSFAFYIGIVGIVATLAALFWRSFDDPVFRSLYSGTLDLIRGSELTIAFIPAILLAVLATVSEVGLSIWRLLFGFERLLPRKIHLIVRKVSLILVVLAIITSMAIFIGNGKTSVSSNAGGELLLNHYAHWLAISAGIIQILLFLGKDRLFRSERAEAKQWQKHLQRSVTTFVLLFLIFAMVHWMGREDISGYTQNRDPHLVRGDVTDWYLLDELFATYEARLRKKSTTGEPQHLNPLDNVPAFAKPPSRWTAFLVAGRTGLGVDNWHNDEELAHPPSPLQTKGGAEDAWSLAKRIRGACVAYSFAMFKAVPENPKEYRESKPDSVTKFVGEAFENVHFAYALQDKRLTLWNKYLQDSQFTSFLIDGNKDDVEPATPSEPPALNATQPDRSLTSTQTDSRDILVTAQLKNLLDSIGGKLTDAERSSLVKTVRSSTVADGQPQEIKDLSSQRLATATANRQLLNVLFPGAVQDPRVASTLVVPPHDQAARKRWLCLWTVLTLVGMIGGLGQNHIATVFQFYRQQLGSNFLVATHDRSQQYCDKQLYELNPTDDGLPFPLFLAATLEPTTCNGSYRIEAKPFVFSPLYCGHFDTDEGLIPSKQLSFSSSPASVAVTLGDAITLSGAAVTPLMTGNRWLSIILDFFNTGIGQRLRRLDRTGRELRRQWSRPIVMSAIVMLLAAIIAHFLIGLNVIMVFVIAVLTCLACYCIVLRIGSLGLITSLFFPRNRDFAKMARADGRSFYVADGGFYDYLGVTELLRRRCELIVVSDTGANIGDDPLGTLAQMCEKASQELGVRFLDLDHEAPIDFGRLKQTEKRLVHQPYLCMRVRYPDPNRPEGRLFYCQMSITDSDPI